MRRIFLAVLTATLASGCNANSGQINLNDETKSISGWIEVGYEYRLHSNRDIENYDPFDRIEADKCVSLIIGNDMLNGRSLRSGDRVTLTGRVMEYAAIPFGDSEQDRLLNKRYYNGLFVPNSCYRSYIFVVDRLSID